MESSKDSKNYFNKLATTSAIIGGTSILGAIGLGAVAGWTRNIYVKVAAFVGALALGGFGFAEATVTGVVGGMGDTGKKDCGCHAKDSSDAQVENSTQWQDKKAEEQRALQRNMQLLM